MPQASHSDVFAQRSRRAIPDGVHQETGGYRCNVRRVLAFFGWDGPWTARNTRLAAVALVPPFTLPVVLAWLDGVDGFLGFVLWDVYHPAAWLGWAAILVFYWRRHPEP
jgi:hypothetical protein